MTSDPQLGTQLAPGLGAGPRRDPPVTGIHVLGPFNSGTSLMFNYAQRVTRIPMTWHSAFWKHSLPPELEWTAGCTWNADAPGPGSALLRRTLLIAMVRNPYFWIVSMSLSDYVAFPSARGGASARLLSPVEFKGRRYPSLASLWNAYYQAYAEHLEPFDLRYVRLEDLVADPAAVVADLSVEVAPDPTVDVDAVIATTRWEPAKVHAPTAGPVGDEAALLYQIANVAAMLEAHEIAEISATLDHELMVRFGYPMLG